MTVPNVTFRWCQKQATCRWCELLIEPATPMVVAFFWNKGNAEQRGFNTQQCYHPNCYIQQGLDYLNMNPYSPHASTGRKPMELTEEERRKRFLLVRKFNELVQRKGKIKSVGLERQVVEERITEKMVDITLEIAKFGGVPKKWANKIR